MQNQKVVALLQPRLCLLWRTYSYLASVFCNFVAIVTTLMPSELPLMKVWSQDNPAQGLTGISLSQAKFHNLKKHWKLKKSQAMFTVHQYF